MSKRPFVPSFLQKSDDKLLRNKPGAWASRTHLVLYFTAVFALLLFLFCYFVFFDTKQYSSVGSWTVFVALIAFVGFVFWLIFLLRFNVFKRYGNWFAMDGLKDFALYFVSIGAMVAVCFIPSAVETWRANQQFGNEEIVKDINELNINACRLEYNLLPMGWDFDTTRIINEFINTPAEVSEELSETVTVDTVANATKKYVAKNYITIDTADLNNRLENSDSLLKINDSLYVFYKCPDYRFVSSYIADNYTTLKIMSSAAIYNNYLKNYQKPDRNTLLKPMDDLKTKYAVSSRYGYNEYYNDDENASYDRKIKKKYDLSRISNGIDNVVRKKYAWKNAWPMYLRIFYYTALLLTLLIFIFRHTTVKAFFLSVLTSVLFTIISGLMLVFKQADEETTLLSFIILYYAVFAGVALSIFKINTRKVVQGIALNLFLFTTPFIPLVFVALTWARRYSNSYNINEEIISSEKLSLYSLIAEIAGFIILLILIQPLFKKLYRKWYSAPEE